MDKTSIPFLGETNSFEEAFPEIASIHIDYAETDGKRTGCIAEPSRFVSYIICGNTQCKDGGYNLEHELRMMMLQRLKNQETTLDCKGKEGSHPQAAPCSNALRLKISVTYKP